MSLGLRHWHRISGRESGHELIREILLLKDLQNLVKVSCPLHSVKNDTLLGQCDSPLLSHFVWQDLPKLGEERVACYVLLKLRHLDSFPDLQIKEGC